MGKSFALELPGEWSKFADERIGPVTTVEPKVTVQKATNGQVTTNASLLLAQTSCRESELHRSRKHRVLFIRGVSTGRLDSSSSKNDSSHDDHPWTPVSRLGRLGCIVGPISFNPRDNFRRANPSQF
jgi:hypothetical protein